jgi:hypothetical protein
MRTARCLLLALPAASVAVSVTGNTPDS